MKFNLSNPTKKFEPNSYKKEVNTEIKKLPKKDQNSFYSKMQIDDIAKDLMMFNGLPMDSSDQYKKMISCLTGTYKIFLNSLVKKGFTALENYENYALSELTALAEFDIAKTQECRQEYKKHKKTYKQLKESFKKIAKNLENKKKDISKRLSVRKKFSDHSEPVIAETVCVITIYRIVDLGCGIADSLLGTFVMIDDKEFGETRLLRGKTVPALKTHNKTICTIDDLFNNGQPDILDIAQGCIGNCYQLSGLQSLVKTDPDAIKSCFLSVENGRIVMRFYKVKIKKIVPNPLTIYFVAGRPIIINLDASTAINGGNESEALWVRFFEKGYTMFRKQGGEPNLFQIINKVFASDKSRKNETITRLSNGTPAILMVAITGNPGKYMHKYRINKVKAFTEKMSKNESGTKAKRYNKKSISVYNEINSALRSGKGVTVAFKVGIQKKNKNFKKVVPFHAYSVTDIKLEDNGYIYVEIRNPWGKDSLTTSGYTNGLNENGTPKKAELVIDPNKDNAIFVMELNDFTNNIFSLQCLS